MFALALLVAACGDSQTTDGDAAAPDDDTTEAAQTEAAEGGDSDDEDEGSATATWDGEAYEYDGASCSTTFSGERFQMLAGAGSGDAPQLDVRFNLDGDDADFSQPNSIELFFDRGETIGEGEGYEARGDATGGVTADESGVSGTIELEPDTETQAPDLNPEGGTLEFEIVCPA